jgi:superfamily II DNA or RNA helicase
LITFHYDKTTCKGQIICDMVVMSLLKKQFSVKNEAAKFMKKHGRNLPDKKYAIDKMGRFDFGLYREILEFLKSQQYKTIDYTDEFKIHLRCGISVDELFDGFTYTHRDFQKEIVTLCLKHGRGTIKSATGSGKSFCVASLVENFWRNRQTRTFKTLIVVPGISLVSQLAGDFENYGVNFTYSAWTGTIKLTDSDIVIVNAENLISKIKENPWVYDVDLLIVDECHRVTTTSKIGKVISKIKTPHKFGFTGTLPKDKYETWKIIGTFGPVLFEKNSKDLRDENILTDVSVKMVKLIHPESTIPKKSKKKDKSPTEDYLAELNFIYNSKKRNEIIKKIASKLKNNTLVLVNHIEHGDALEKELKALPDKQIIYIKGDVDLQNRLDSIQNMETDDNIVCVAMSSIFSTGINIKNLHNIIFVSGGKSFIRIVQGIGRGLRLHENKRSLVIIDICDNLKYSEDHAVERKTIYDDEQIPWSEREIIL